MKNNSNGNINNMIKINRFRQSLMYKTTDKEWISFLKLGINYFKCV